VAAVRSRGLWAGVDFKAGMPSGREVCHRLRDRGVLAKDTHGQTIRLAPPLVIDRADLDYGLDQLAAVVDGLSQA
jgi:ornithine--oxo-acid transaminase